VNLTVSLVRNAAGEPQYFISIVEDINARKQAEAEVRLLNATLEHRVSERTRQLDEVIQEMEAFAYSVSHDLRAPLRAMQGFAQALQEDFADHLGPLAQQYCRRIVAAAARMDTLILDLLAYSRISRAHLQLQPLSLDAALQEALNFLEVEIHESQAQVVIQTPLPWVRAHPATLGQVVSNLLSNAIKFVEPGVWPQVEVWAEPREEGTGARAAGERGGAQRRPAPVAEGAKKRRWVRLWVADNGIGIDPAHQERIFRVFERLHGIEAYPGTGIGLAIVKKGIERMGGRVGVESRLEAGSRFWVELPYAEQLSEAADAERIQNSAVGGR
jgi:signal transduction histidine kinase